MLEVIDLVKRYGERVAVDRVSFRAARGETVGLLGPNGAGKTTTLAMVSGLVPPDAGSVRIAGRALADDQDAAKRMIGLVPQDLALYDEVAARANLEVFGALYGLRGAALRRAIDDALELVALSDRANDRVSTFSGGMKRRLNIAGALLHDPMLMLFDEPTVGVDPQSRNAIFDNLAELKRRGKTVVYTTHYMEEAERLCDRIVIVDHGRVLADDALPALLARATRGNRLLLDLTGAASADLQSALMRMPGVHEASIESAGERLSVLLDDLARTTPSVLAAVAESGLAVRSLASERPNLESVFLGLTGRTLRDTHA